MEQRLWQVEELVRGKPAGWREYLVAEVAVTTPVSRSRENSRGEVMVTWPILTTPTSSHLTWQKWVNW